MLRGAYSQINNFSKLILLIMLVCSFLLFSTLLGILVLVPFFGTGVINIFSAPDYSSVAVVNGMKAIQILNMAGGLLLPACIYMWLCLPNTKTYGGFGKSISYLPMVLSALLIVTAQPLIGWTSELNSYLTLPEGFSLIENWMKKAEEQGIMITDAFLSTTSISGLLVNIFMVAILPAFAEEILFRGALAGLIKDWTKNVHLAVFISAFIFAAIHMQFYGFLPRFLLGTALGYLYFRSGSLWLPIVAHFTNNFLSVIVEFLFRKRMIHTNAENFGLENSSWLTVFSITGVIVIFYFIYTQTTMRNKEG